MHSPRSRHLQSGTNRGGIVMFHANPHGNDNNFIVAWYAPERFPAPFPTWISCTDGQLSTFGQDKQT